MSEKSQVALINEQINRELTKETAGALLATTFKGLTEVNMKKAIMEGMIRGLTFKDFLEKNVYAIPFKDGYSLVTSIDYARKIGMRSGIVGKDEPIFEEEDGKIISCKVTVKRKVSGEIGNFTAKVYFKEYDKGSNLWSTKPRTMISKVAEMHALRMACPEELSQNYVEEELELENRENRFSKVRDVESKDLSMGNFIKNEENKDETIEKGTKEDAGGSENK